MPMTQGDSDGGHPLNINSSKLQVQEEVGKVSTTFYKCILLTVPVPVLGVR